MKTIIIALALTALVAPAFANDKPECPGDVAVWVNSKSHIYHRNSVTKNGEFQCEQEALKSGARAAANEKKAKTDTVATPK